MFMCVRAATFKDDMQMKLIVETKPLPTKTTKLAMLTNGMPDIALGRGCTVVHESEPAVKVSVDDILSL